MEKNKAQIGGFTDVRKAPSPEVFFWKKILPDYLHRYDIQNNVWNFFRRNGYRDI